MAIGLFAIGFAGLCGLACLLSAGRPEPEKKNQADYGTIYKAITPKEI